ncbi:MAG: amidohydrolase family protein [Deltaproteobacteria bacterium]|nr:amidohydrolase family protein [Deltaproteobacteria bacterium]
MSTPHRIIPLSLLLFSLAACRETPATRADAGVGPGGDAGGGADGSLPDGSSADAGAPTACNNPPLVPPSSGTCSVTSGDARLLIRGDLLLPSGILENAQLLVSDDGRIACAACDCSASPGFATATKIDCAEGLVTPGFINAHDHLTFDEAPPADHGTEVYEHRHDWRKGIEGHDKIPTQSNQGGELGVRWAEIRMLMSGATSINGSGSAAGLLRNLDRAGGLEGLTQPIVRYSTFPLRDSGGTKLTSGCSYGTAVDRLTDNAIAQAEAYTPHVSEGVDLAARNEFLCLSGLQSGGSDIITAKTAIIHGIGLITTDYQELAREQTSLIWSPRSNIDLYGHTAQVTIASRAGVNIALGTDWTPSGSMNVLRELRCADGLNRQYFGGHFTDAQLIAMATSGGARALWSDDLIGSIRPGLYADLAIFDASTRSGYRAVLDAQPEDVVLVLRGGEALYGDDALIATLPSGTTGCEEIEVCLRTKRLCVERDTGTTLQQIQDAIRSDAYPLFFCGSPMNEPSCIPRRPGEFTGMSVADDQDGDGVLDSADNCPSVFNAPRELDQGAQPNLDSDPLGDACDPCPFSTDNSGCPPPNPNDRDGDTVDDAQDNCPGSPNTDQADADGDMVGDACDSCPGVANAPGAACPVTVYAVKQGIATGLVSIADVIVTGVAPVGYFVQVDPAGSGYDATLRERYSGIFVYTGRGGPFPAIGDRLSVDGSVDNFYDTLELINSTFTVVATGQPLPAPIVPDATGVATGGAREDELEAVLIEVQAVTVTNVDPDPGPGDARPTHELEVDGGLRINDLMYALSPAPAQGAQIGYIRGILRHANDLSKLEPRGANDVGQPARLLEIAPTLAFIEAGSTASVLSVVLTRTATAPLDIQISSSSADATVPARVTVPSGSDRAPIPITAVAASTSTHTVTARLGADTVQGRVRIYDAATPRRLVALELQPARLAPSATSQGRVAIDLPAGAGGLSIPFSVAPAGLASTAASVQILAGRSDAAFALIAGASTGSGEVIATLGNTLRASFVVEISTTRAPGAGDLVITEVHYNASGATEKVQEWFEIHNPTPDSLTLAGVLVEDKLRRHTLPASAPVVAPGGYAVLAYSSDTAVNGGIADAIAYSAGDLQLANNDGRVRLSLNSTVIDELSWSGAWPGGANGQSMCLLAPYAADNSAPAAWGSSVGTYGPLPDLGHPGVASSASNCVP